MGSREDRSSGFGFDTSNGFNSSSSSVTRREHSSIIGTIVVIGFNEVRTYWPTLPEMRITIGIRAIGLLIPGMLYKIAISVRESTAGVEIEH